MKAPAIASCFCVALACVIATSAICAPAPAPQVDVAYDIVARVIVSGTPPPPDSFGADADRIAKLPPYHFNSGPAAPSMAAGLLTGLISAIPGVGSFLAAGASMAAGTAFNAAQKHAQEENAAEARALMSAGRITQIAYYRGWRRVTTGQYATITKPDQGLTLVLDSTKKTYTSQRVDPGITTYTVDATPAPVSELVGTPKYATLAPTTIDRQRVRGYHLSGALQSAQPVGWCKAGNHEVDIVEYVADLPDPDNAPAKAPDPASVLASACQPSTTASAFEPGKLVMYRSFSMRPSIAGDITIVTELGNIRTTGERDAALFSPPSDFTEEH
jgi:hypothetical protein